MDILGTISRIDEDIDIVLGDMRPTEVYACRLLYG